MALDSKQCNFCDQAAIVQVAAGEAILMALCEQHFNEYLSDRVGPLIESYQKHFGPSQHQTDDQRGPYETDEK